MGEQVINRGNMNITVHNSIIPHILQNKFEENVRREDETSNAKRTYPA